VPAPYFDMGDEDEDKVDQGAKLRRYWAAIKRFRWIIIVLAILGTAAGVAATRLIQPMYEAHGKVWIADVNNGGKSSVTYRPELLPAGSWIELFRSATVVNRVVAETHIWYTPKNWQDSTILRGMMPTPRTVSGDYTLALDPSRTHYTLSDAKRGVVEQGIVGDSVGRAIGVAWLPSPAVLTQHPTVSFWIAQPDAVAVGLAERVRIAMQDQSNFLNLTLSGLDKWKTAELLNVWMREFVEMAAELRRRNSSDVADLTEAQRTAALQRVEEAENRLQAFRTNAITQPGEAAGASAAAPSGGGGGDLLSSRFFQNKLTVDNLKRDRLALDKIAADGRAGVLIPDAVFSIPATAQMPDLTAAVRELIDKQTQLRVLRQSYTDEQRQVQEAASVVQQLRTQTIPQLALEGARALQARESELAGAIARDSLTLRSIPARSIQESQLRRELSDAEQAYSQVQTQYETAHRSALSAMPDVSIFDPAIPAMAAQRNIKALLVLGGFGGALAFGVALALLLDLLDHRFRYSEQITDELKLEVIGAVPKVPKVGDAMDDPEAMLHRVEAFRGLRMRIHHAFDAPPVMVTVTSPCAGDGKSMIASNLALSFAEAGYRTLLIDGDIRRGKLHSVFSADRRPGLLDYLAGEAELPDIMREVGTNGRLTLIPCGTRRHRGPELLTSARLPALFNTMRTRYDAIIVDSAPLGAGVDSFALGVTTRNMVLVMRTGVTDRRIAKAKMKLLTRFPIRMIGAIVNDVPASGLHYEYSYLYGYGPNVDVEADPQGEMPVLRPADSVTG
jgi:capsular exopolysaccharide synthesis family protein